MHVKLGVGKQKMAQKSKLKSLITLVDVGTSKICGMTVRFNAEGKAEVIATGYAPSRGINAGAIVDLNAASDCIGEVLGQLDQQLGAPVTEVVVNISSTQLKSQHLVKEIELNNTRPITAQDVKRLVDAAIGSSLLNGDEVIHAVPLSYAVDNEGGVSDPRGLYGYKLSVNMHVITLPETQSRNLLVAFDRHHVSIGMKVATPYASALAVLSDEEKDLGATVLDFGAGTTSVVMFLDGGLMHLELINQGGNIFSKDIACGLNCSMDVAERLKALHGAAFTSPKDTMDRLIVPVLGDEGATTQVPKSELIGIIVPRLEEIVESVGRIFKAHPKFLVSTRHIVLTGGGSMLLGIKDKVFNMLGGNVRLGKPDFVSGLPNHFESYTFSTCIGLLKYAMIRERSVLNENFKPQTEQKRSLWGKVIQWLVQNF